MCDRFVSSPIPFLQTGQDGKEFPGRTFLTGEVGVVTWLVGLVGEDTVTLVGVVLLLTAAEGLLFSAEVQKNKKHKQV